MASLYFGNKLIEDHGILTLSEAEQPIKLSWQGISDKNYVVLLYDLDASSPDNPIMSPYIHYLAVSIPGMNVDDGLEVFNYQAPIPNIGRHRYVFEIFEQSVGFSINIYERSRADLYALTKQLKMIFQIEFIVDPDL